MQLTEDMILNRSKQSKLQNVRELNLCGYSLSDVSAISKLPNLEVLALSVNNIRSLAPFADCMNLKELYLRRNCIDDIGQLFYLQRLPSLQSIWLIENPFCMELGFNYRTAVLSILPNIKVLDNEAVSREEVDRSKNMGIQYDPLEYAGSPPTSLSNPKLDSMQVGSNVLTAIYSLVKDLDINGLEALHHSVEKRINQIYTERQ